jgi:hypothetical protein
MQDESTREQILAVLRDLATTESDIRLRSAAAYLADFLPTAR